MVERMLRYQKLKLYKKDELAKKMEEKGTKPIDFKKNGSKILMKELKDVIEHENCHDLLHNHKSENNAIYPFDKVIEEIERVITTAENYVADLLSCIFLRFGDLIMPNDYELSEKEIQEDIYNAWKWVDQVSQINKVSICKNYPVPVVLESNNRRIGGGCIAFHHAMISNRNIGMFDLDTEIGSIKRYSYIRMRQIYEELEEQPIQNLLLAEMSLGLGYTNFLYTKMKDIHEYELLNRVLSSIKPYSQMEMFFIRKKVVGVILKHLNLDTYDRRGLEDICNELENLANLTKRIICDIFDKVIKKWWKHYLMYAKSIDADDMFEYIRNSWTEYYDDSEAYEDHVEHYRIHDWRNIKKLEDCFYNIPGFTVDPNDGDEEKREKYNRDKMKNVDIYTMINVCIADLNGKKVIVEGPANDMGKEILKKVEKKCLKISEIPDEKYDLYDLFYKERQEAYNEIRENDKIICEKGDIKHSEKSVNMKCIHQYAEIQHEVMKGLLRHS